jgi:flavin reductase (DIM6/NTAB) family NADH-FMN oxidoreductase RutF
MGDGYPYTYHPTGVIGLIKHSHIRDDLIDARGRVDIHRLQPVGRPAGAEYCYVREIFAMQRP